jgi:hypothetical protein
VGLESMGAVTWLSETAPESDEPPPQATSNVESRQRQKILTDACVNSFRAKAVALGK